MPYAIRRSRRSRNYQQHFEKKKIKSEEFIIVKDKWPQSDTMHAQCAPQEKPVQSREPNPKSQTTKNMTIYYFILLNTFRFEGIRTDRCVECRGQSRWQ